jgi:enoyl-CoA hydratase
MTVTIPDSIGYDKDGVVATVTLNRPEARNAILPEMIVALNSIMIDFDNDPELYVMILTGAGDKAFCAGGDLKVTIPARTSGSAAAAPRDRSRRFFSEVTKPIIAAVNGYALAGGLEMILGTDIRVAAEHARFGLTEPRWALLAAGGGNVRLSRQIPFARAMEMLLIGDQIDAATALEYGLINRVVPAEDLMPTARALAERIAENGPLAIRKIKETVLRTYGMSWDQAFFVESLAADQVFASEDAKEGPRAFAEKRKPNFLGR